MRRLISSCAIVLLAVGCRSSGTEDSLASTTTSSSSTTADPTPQEQELQLFASASSGAVELTWSEYSSSDLVTYTVYTSDGSGAGFSLLAEDLLGTTYTDTGLNNGTTYSYQLYAYDSLGQELAVSETVSATPFAPSTDVDAQFTPSRTSGVAPLVVYFDATSTTAGTSSRPFHELSYEWNFGDSQAGTWSTNGKSKNLESGAVAGHVFDRPGTYTVRLTVRDAAGNTGTRESQITVTDPDSVFAGDRTVCVSQQGNFFGAPPGAVLVQTTSLSEAFSYIGNGRRVLLRRGETWNTTLSYSMDSSDGILGTYGSGNNPVINLLSGGQQLINYGRYNGSSCSNWRFMDLVIDGGNNSGSIAFNRNSSAPVSRNVLFYRLTVRNCGGGGMFPLKQNGQWPDGMAVVDCNMSNIGGHSNCVLGEGERFLMAGNTFRGNPQGGHAVRFGRLQRSSIVHNDFSYAMPGAQVLLRVTAANYTNQDSMTRYVIVADNRLDGAEGTGGWICEVAGIDNSADYRLEHIIVERNHFRLSDNSTQTSRGVRLNGRDFTIRNNTFDAGVTSNGGNFINIWKQASAWDNARVNVYNNTGYASSDVRVIINMIYFGDSTSLNCDIRNNLFYNRSSQGGVFLAGRGQNMTESNNLDLSAQSVSDVFISGTPTTADGLQLESSSAARDSGAIVPGVFEDCAGNDRPTDGGSAQNPAPDVGAFEYTP